MITLLVAFVLIPIGIFRALLKALLHWQRVPLQQKNQARAGMGAAALALIAGAWAGGYASLVPPVALAGAAGFAALWLAVGLVGAHGARFDFMSAFWWAVAALGCGALLLFKGMI